MEIEVKNLTIDLRGNKKEIDLYLWIWKECQKSDHKKMATTIKSMLYELRHRRENPNGLIAIEDKITGQTLSTITPVQHDGN